MNDFKVGDRVEYVGTTSTAIIGKVGAVVEPPFANSGMVYFDHGGSEPYGAYSQNLRLINPDVITINRADLPEVVERDGKFFAGSGPEECMARGSENPNWLRNHANSALALADFLEARNKAAEEAKAVLDERLAALDCLSRGALIDRIIELEDSHA